MLAEFKAGAAISMLAKPLSGGVEGRGQFGAAAANKPRVWEC